MTATYTQILTFFGRAPTDGCSTWSVKSLLDRGRLRRGHCRQGKSSTLVSDVGEELLEIPNSAHPASDLTDEQLLLCSTRVRGYSLKLKCWATFEVDKISSIIWNDAAFPNLMLPSGYKNLILSFVEGQSTNKCVFDDIIEGKGLGIIMLLVGHPGTGKTLTAEAVADKVRKPLYVLSAGELGQEAGDIESRLSTVLELAKIWDAVLLFDECDVFLQERSMSHLAHNEIVAVFLR